MDDIRFEFGRLVVSIGVSLVRAGANLLREGNPGMQDALHQAADAVLETLKYPGR